MQVSLFAVGSVIVLALRVGRPLTFDPHSRPLSIQLKLTREMPITRRCASTGVSIVLEVVSEFVCFSKFFSGAAPL